MKLLPSKLLSIDILFPTSKAHWNAKRFGCVLAELVLNRQTNCYVKSFKLFATPNFFYANVSDELACSIISQFALYLDNSKV